MMFRNIVTDFESRGGRSDRPCHAQNTAMTRHPEAMTAEEIVAVQLQPPRAEPTNPNATPEPDRSTSHDAQASMRQPPQRRATPDTPRRARSDPSGSHRKATTRVVATS